MSASAPHCYDSGIVAQGNPPLYACRSSSSGEGSSQCSTRRRVWLPGTLGRAAVSRHTRIDMHSLNRSTAHAAVSWLLLTSTTRLNDALPVVRLTGYHKSKEDKPSKAFRDSLAQADAYLAREDPPPGALELM